MPITAFNTFPPAGHTVVVLTLAFRFLPLVADTAPLDSLDIFISCTFSYRALVNLSVLASRKVLRSSVNSNHSNR